MKLRQSLQVVLGAIVLSLAFLTVTALPGLHIAPKALAASYQGNQAVQAGILIAPKPDEKISVYIKPSTSARRVGYGMGGDRVTILEQIGSNEGYTWNRVQLEAPSPLEGWVRQDFVSLQPSSGASPNGQTQQSPSTGNRYLGNQQQVYQGNQSQSRYQQQQN